MKQQLSLIIFLLINGSLIFSCTSKKGAHTLTFMSLTEKNASKLTAMPPREIEKPKEASAEAAYKLHPSITDYKTKQAVWGYMLDTGDFKKLISIANINNIYLKFGITDSVMTSEGMQYYYTLMVIPVDKANNSIEFKPGFSAYDFVCPCVNGVGCCPK